MSDSMVKKLGRYKGLKAKKTEVSVADAEIEERFEKEKTDRAEKIFIRDRGIQPGDIAVIDYRGFVDDRPFDGGAKQDYPMEIGAGTSFIPGFDDQLEAAEIGDKINVHVTFPADFGAKTLNGKRAVYKCLIKDIYRLKYPVLDDALRAELKEIILDEKNMQAESELQDELLRMIIDDSDMLLDTTEVDEMLNGVFSEWVHEIEAQGLNYEKWFKVMGSDEEKQRDVLRSKAEFRLASRLVMEAVAEAENLQATEDEVNEQVGYIAEHIGMPADELKKRFKDEDYASVRSDICMFKAMEFIMDSAIYD